MKLCFNKKLTKQLLKCSDKLPILTKTRLDWVLEEKEEIYGCIYKGLFGTATFVIIKVKEEYRLICLNNGYPYIYVIMGIENFLQMVGLDKLICDEEELMTEFIIRIKKLPITGVALVQNNKLFLYDSVK